MPIYTYRCEDGHEFEIQQGINDEPLTTCGRPHLVYEGMPEVPCPRRVKRIIVPGTSFRLTGSGWTPKFHR